MRPRTSGRVSRVTWLLNATLRLRVYLGSTLLFDNDLADIVVDEDEDLFTGASHSLLLEYGNCTMAVSDALQLGQVDADADVTIICRGVNITIDSPIVVSLWYNVTKVKAAAAPINQIDTLYAFSVWRIELVPDAPRIAVWEGLLAPGDVFNMTCSGGECSLVMVDDGLLAYWGFEGSLGEETGVQGSWVVGGDAVLDWGDGLRGEAAKLYVGLDGAWLNVTVSSGTPALLVLHLGADLHPLMGVEASVYLDDRLVESMPVDKFWERVTIPVPPGVHHIALKAWSWNVAENLYRATGGDYYLPLYVDHALLVKDTSVVLHGLRPGDRVYLYLETPWGTTLYTTLTAAGETVTLNIPVALLPAKARIVVIRP